MRRDVLGDLQPLEAQAGYVESTFRESRGPQVQFTYLTGRDRLAAIRDMPLLDVATGESIKAGICLPLLRASRPPHSRQGPSPSLGPMP
ncbi:MAG: hypothetical protein IPO28_00440 [Holophagaceae bacterium]|nr:hypothetical protein [Holophagaceae bacterium]